MNWNEIIGLNDDQIEDLRYVGFSYIKQGKYDVALKLYEALALLNPLNAYDLQTLGGLYLEMNDNLKALGTIERALKIEPNHDATLLNRAKALFGLSYRRQAIAQAKQLAAHPNPEIASQAEALLLAYS
jgi:tetratricopeptide (TPR) repeat protein